MPVTADEIHVKQPSEKRLYSIDFTQLLAKDGTETLANIESVFSSRRGGGGTDELIFEDTEISISSGAKHVQMEISGGVHHQTYRIEVIVTTNKGQILEGDALLRISDR